MLQDVRGKGGRKDVGLAKEMTRRRSIVYSSL